MEMRERPPQARHLAVMTAKRPLVRGIPLKPRPSFCDFTKKITVRLTDKEYAKLREMSETSGLKMEPVIRKLLVGYEIRPRPNATYIKLIKELSAVGNNLNQIAHLANATGKITEDQWKETHQLLEKIWDFCAYEL